jgi:NAD(P)H dehydrogenase (quinone)
LKTNVGPPPSFAYKQTHASKIQIIFYSMYGHVWKLAEAIAQGARDAGASVEIFQVAETLSPEILAKMGATEARKAFAHIPIADPKRLPEADAIILGSPTRYGSKTAQLQAFIDATGPLWSAGALIGKLGSAFLHRQPARGTGDNAAEHVHLLLPPGHGHRRCAL